MKIQVQISWVGQSTIFDWTKFSTKPSQCSDLWSFLTQPRPWNKVNFLIYGHWVWASAILFRLPREEKNTESRVSFPYFFQGRADQAGQGAEGDLGGQGAEGGVMEWRLLLFWGWRRQSQARQVSSCLMKRKIQKQRSFRDQYLAQSPPSVLTTLADPKLLKTLVQSGQKHTCLANLDMLHEKWNI